MNQDRIKFLEDLLVNWAKDIERYHDVTKFNLPTDALLTEAHRIIEANKRLARCGPIDPSTHAPCGCPWKDCKCGMLSCQHIAHRKGCVA